MRKTLKNLGFPRNRQFCAPERSALEAEYTFICGIQNACVILCDVQKAFDAATRKKLYEKLCLEIGLPHIYINALILLLGNVNGSIFWDNLKVFTEEYFQGLPRL